jgi:hypothetical protein
MPTRIPTSKQVNPKAIWCFVIGVLLSDLMLGDQPNIGYAAAGVADPHTHWPV